MKFYSLLIFAALFYSCNGDSSHKRAKLPKGIDGEIRMRTVTDNLYNDSGRLYRSDQTQYLYHKGEVGDAIKFLITRDYDNRNNLISEKKFQVFKRDKELSEEKTFEYDAKNNCVLGIDKFENVNSSIIKRTYNDLNQEVKNITIQKRFDEDIKPNWTLDSMVAHHDDKKPPPRYDSTITTYSYDKNGNQIRRTHLETNGEAGTSYSTIYVNGEKAFTYEIGENGDTAEIMRYAKEGTLLKETTEDKFVSHMAISTWYDGKKKVKELFLDKIGNRNTLETWKYDINGNEIEYVSYR